MQREAEANCFTERSFHPQTRHRSTELETGNRQLQREVDELRDRVRALLAPPSVKDSDKSDERRHQDSTK
jgi:hypothetical protein